MEREFQDGEFHWGSISIQKIDDNTFGVLIFNLQREGDQTHMLVTYPENNNLYNTCLCILNKLTEHIGRNNTGSIVFGYTDCIWLSNDMPTLDLTPSNVEKFLTPSNNRHRFDRNNTVRGWITEDYIFTYEGEPWSSPL